MQNKTILIADDNTFIRRLVSVALQPLGCTLIEAVDGEDTLRVIEAQRPDLVLLDLVMPKLSGFEVLEIIRATPKTADLTVIMLTTAAAASDLA
ncbi:MAG: response regulator, partial [Actinobacteria bacterium]|nr:response regulator [Actinomycetota bacterium]